MKLSMKKVVIAPVVFTYLVFFMVFIHGENELSGRVGGIYMILIEEDDREWEVIEEERRRDWENGDREEWMQNQRQLADRAPRSVRSMGKCIRPG